MLDIACNCAYWSSLYVEVGGAKSMVGIEGRIDYIKQGQLYWEKNKFTEEFMFWHGNVLDENLWKRMFRDFDFTLCAGILYHVDDYEKLLRYACDVTKEAILVDTRVSSDDKLIQEPGGFCFDAIEDTSTKRIPTLESLMNILKDKGFKNIERITTNAVLPKGMASHDNYDKGRRVCILAKR